MGSELTGKQGVIAEAIRAEMSSGKSLEQATRAVMQSKKSNHMTVRRAAEKLERDLSMVDKWKSGE